MCTMRIKRSRLWVLARFGLEVHHHLKPLNIFPIFGSLGNRATGGVDSAVIVHLG
jgi:hypothetical protein